MSPLRQVDRLDIQVLVDNVTDSLSSTPAFVTREWVTLRRQGMRITAGGSLCCANHGLALVITAHGPSGARTLLFDGGPVDYAVERNGVRLGIDFGGASVLERYQSWRRYDTLEMGLMTDALNRLFSNDNPALRILRDVGLGMVDRLPRLKDWFVGEASGAAYSAPRLLIGEAI